MKEGGASVRRTCWGPEVYLRPALGVLTEEEEEGSPGELVDMA